MLMVKSKEEIQEEWDENERKREKRRKQITQELGNEIEKDKKLLQKKIDELELLKNRSATSYDVNENIDSIEKEINEIRRRIDTNTEIKEIIDPNKQYYQKHGDIFDDILDRPFDSHGGIGEGTRQATLPLKGAGLMLLLEIRERYYKWKEKDKSKSQ
jgi:hypothetical protein